MVISQFVSGPIAIGPYAIPKLEKEPKSENSFKTCWNMERLRKKRAVALYPPLYLSESTISEIVTSSTPSISLSRTFTFSEREVGTFLPA